VINPLLPATLLQMANPEISESLPTLGNVVYPRYEDSESKRRDDEAGKFDDKPDNRINCLMTRDSSQREPFNNYRWLETCSFLTWSVLQ